MIGETKTHNVKFCNPMYHIGQMVVHKSAIDVAFVIINIVIEPNVLSYTVRNYEDTQTFYEFEIQPYDENKIICS